MTGKSANLLGDGPGDAVIRGEIAIDEADEVILVEGQLRIVEEVAEDPGAQIRAVEHVPAAGQVSIAGEPAGAVRAESTHCEIGEHEDREVGPDLRVGRLSSPVHLEPVDEEPARDRVELPIGIAATFGDGGERLRQRAVKLSQS